MRDPLAPPLDLFIRAAGLLGFLHVLVYSHQYGAPLFVSGWVIAGLGITLMLAPHSRACIAGMLVAVCVDSVLQMPALSNHTIIKNFFSLALVSALAYGLSTQKTWAEIWNGVAPVGRSLLLLMYVYGVFHKINSDFLNPEVSCAVILWKQMPWPLSSLDGLPWRYLLMYGTLIAESVIFIALLIPRLRHLGITCGIAFHALLALSDYAMYAPFSALSIALHLLFLSPEAATRVVQDSLWQRVTTGLRTSRGIAVFVGWLIALYLLAWLGQFSSVGVVWLLGVSPLAVAVIRSAGSTSEGTKPLLWAKPWPLNLISLLFLLNGITPYLGLKTAQSINMFANLRLEGGISNHLIIRAVGPFGYLDDLVRITDPGNSNYFKYIADNDLRLVYYDFLNRLERQPEAIVGYERSGVLHKHASASTLREEMQNELHPRWFRTWFHFTPVDIRSPKPCALDR